MRNMGNSGKMAIGAITAALALLVLTGLTLHETVFLWFLAACAAAYVACAAELMVRRRHRTLAACGFGSILFIAFGIAFLRQWGLAFNPDPGALSAPVDSDYPDLYFYLAAVSGAATLLLLFAGMVLPGRAHRQRPRQAARRRPASRPASRGPAKSPAARQGTVRTGTARTGTARTPASRTPAPRPRTSTARPAAKPPAGSAARGAARRR